MACALRSIANLLLLTLLLQACVPEEPLPEGMLTESQMVEILTEMSIVEGARSGARIINDTLYANDLYVSIFQKHNLEPEGFQKSLEWYNARPDRILPVWDRVIENLQVLEAQYGLTPPGQTPLDVLPDSMKYKTDSLKKAIRLRVQDEEASFK